MCHRTVGMAEAAGFEAIEIEDADLAAGFGGTQPKVDWSPVEQEMLQVIGIDKLLALERATVEKGNA
jgi:hypothetical protein